MNMAIGEAINEALIDLAQTDNRLVVLNCDVAKSVGIRDMGKKYPEKFIQMGISEQDMILSAAGLASCGYIPVATTFAKFGSLRVAEQISTFVAYAKQNVKIVVSHAGISPGQDGVTHQAVEDLGLMRAIPGMTVIEPFDADSAKQLFMQAYRFVGPVYFRMHREKLPLLNAGEVTLGKAVTLRKGNDVGIIAMGGMVVNALEAAEQLSAQGVEASVLAIHTLKPIDEEAIAELSIHTGALVTVENHNINAGLGDAVASVVCQNTPVPVIRVGMKDEFAQSGTYSQLVQKYGLAAEDIVAAAHKAISKKC